MKDLKFRLCLILLILSTLFACQFRINKEDLTGKWLYTKYEYTNKSTDKPLADIESQKPFIFFHEDGKAEIFSSGRLLSQGTYTLENRIIRYEEVLENGVKRKIPFLIKELDKKHLVFETMEAESKRITAEKTN